MPAQLFPKEAIPGLAAKIDSLAELLVLRHLQKETFVLNGPDVGPRMASILHRLTGLGLVDPGYEGESTDRPSMWLGNGNGSRVVRAFDASPTVQETLVSRVVLGHRARTAMSSLTEWEQAQVLAAVELLQSGEKASWEAEGVESLGEGKQVYLLRASPELRAFARVKAPGEVELFDIVREDTLQMFLERNLAGSRVG